ncbi:MAG: hypothetical protein K9L29_12310, partial [Spirochaetales bacterium]|nr:hypothetical protein [Spirochaetales bacterium]
MRIGTYQFAPIFGDLNANRSRVELELTRRLDRYTDSTGSAPDFLVLPELAFSGYHFTSPAEAKSLGEPVDGESASVLLRLAQRFGTHIAAGYAELAEDGSLYNSSMLVGPNGIEGNYRKVHLFHEETIHFRPGDNTAPGGSRETAADPE